jgi:hypothetical protein
MPTRKNLGKSKIRTVKNVIIKPPPSNKKGIVYLIEPIKTTSSQKGDIIKKYVNGKLVKQIFASSQNIKMAVKKVLNKHKKYHNGGGENDGQKVQIETSDKTTFFQSLKNGFAGGFGVFAAADLVDYLFN